MNWRAVIIAFVAAAIIYLFFACVYAVEVRADVPEELTVVTFDDCYVTSTLKARGADTSKCVEYLDTAARLARAEARVNRGRKARR